MNESSTAIIQINKATPTSISPITFHNSAVSPSLPMIHQSLSGKYTDQHACAQCGQRQPDPEPLPNITLASCPSLDQETVQLELATSVYKIGTLTLGPLGQYWNKDHRQNMFHGISPNQSPESVVIHTNDHTLSSPYEQKLVTTRLMTPEPTETKPSMLVVTTTSPTVTHTLPQFMS